MERTYISFYAQSKYMYIYIVYTPFIWLAASCIVYIDVHKCDVILTSGSYA